MRTALLSLLAGLTLVVPASAQVISGGGSWSSIGSATNDGGQFWDRQSADGENCNLGYYVTTGWGTCSNVRNGTAGNQGIFSGGGLYYNNSGAATNFLFTGSRHYTINVLGGIGNIYTADPTEELSEIGYYTVSGGTYTYYSQASWLAYFTSAPGSSETLPSAVTFGTSKDWGFYYIRIRNFDDAGTQCEVTLTSEYCSGTLDTQYWSLMKRPGENYFVASADNQSVNSLNVTTRDGDYNDYMFSVTASPEPASMALVATGLLGLVGAGYVRRRRNS